MKVLHIITAAPYDEREVITPWLWEVLKGLRDRGVDVHILCPSFKGRRGDRIYGFKVHRYRYFLAEYERLSYETAIPELLKSDRRYYLLIPFYLVSGILKAISLLDENYNIVHVHWPFPMALLSLPFKLRFVPIVHSYYTAEIKLAKSLGILGGMIKILVHTANVRTAISSYVKTLLGREDIKVIPYASSIRLAKFHKPKDRVKEPIILFVGRLVERKGVDYLLKAARILKDRGLRFKVHIVGDGPERGKLVRLKRELGLEDEVIFKGKVDSESLVNEYMSSDIFVLPSIVDSRGDTEGLGVVLIEALSFGLPVIATNVGGIPDIVINGETGILVPQKDPEELSSAVEYLLKNWEEAKKLVINGQKRIREYFSTESVVSKILEIYEGLV